MKKAIILEHGGGELANQLWNYASVYAFARELGIELKNPSFFEYHSCFTILPEESLVTQLRAAFFRAPRRRSYPLNRIARLKYKVVSKSVEILRKECVISSANAKNDPTYLPPSGALPSRYEACDTVYFSGWLFRNPEGLKKRRDDIVRYFRPNDSIEARVTSFIAPLREKYARIIGVHLRQGDYRSFKDGAYWIEQERLKEVLEEYISRTGIDREKSLFVFASDGAIDISLFSGINVKISGMNAVEDLFMLSRTDAVIGSDSSFGDFAAYYGDIPHIICSKDPIDWEYYQGKDRFFQNKYCTMVQY